MLHQVTLKSREQPFADQTYLPHLPERTQVSLGCRTQGLYSHRYAHQFILLPTNNAELSPECFLLLPYRYYPLT